MENPVVAIQRLYNETVSELKKCSWPSRQELYESTLVVVSSLIILSVFVVVVDFICEAVIRYITMGL
ncbi:MAG TPA: preprotein translocase subunit SecE [Lentisphaeria bacterium]|jgi:preprotein translocase subunit SecE|nr:preprotein translocase subunit SecE [Lentisphaerota bacterium]OQC16193.1 MAG: preprotein translocase subunit SecE [Lentisphaerae bacterium ADurb.Bin082]HPY91294.1 preprotein translocase subunit SecE [Lentisphaeria bacterium]HQC53648.1 preprotein translocase subunit SecE [Lentisphaeria bacterium]HQL88944.1 preprotein translocase subunit SecE [Lentisphaeria bacterium]